MPGGWIKVGGVTDRLSWESWRLPICERASEVQRLITARAALAAADRRGAADV